MFTLVQTPKKCEQKVGTIVHPRTKSVNNCSHFNFEKLETLIIYFLAAYDYMYVVCQIFLA